MAWRLAVVRLSIMSIFRMTRTKRIRHGVVRYSLRRPANGELHARYQQRYLNIAPCGARVAPSEPALRKPVRKDHNAGGESSWMQGFFDRPSPPLWKAIGE